MGAPSVLTYDNEDRLKTFMGQTYTYNGFDTRVGKNGTTYHRDGTGVTAPLISDSGATYTPGVSERRNGVSTFLNAGLKDVAKQTDISGNVTATRKYDAYGMVIGSTGTWKGPFGYSGSAGYQEDETGLQLLGHRYYDSSTGRFITRDPIKDGRNWYVYCDNNPVSRIDANGLEWHDPCVVYVDPNFKGTVIVVGEPSKGARHASVEVAPGYHSHEGMDVDYVIIIQPDGTTHIIFIWGTETPVDGKDVTQYFLVTAGGEILGPGYKDDIGNGWGHTELGALPLFNEGLQNDVPKNRRPKKGRPVGTPVVSPNYGKGTKIGGGGFRKDPNPLPGGPVRLGPNPIWN